MRNRLELRQIQTYALGGVTETGPWELNYEVAYAFAEEDDSQNHDVTFRFEDIQDAGAGNIFIDTSNPQTPIITGQTALDLILDPSNFALDELEEEVTLNQDTEYSAKLNIARDTVIGQTPVEWKIGGKYRDREKTRDVNLTFSEADDVFADEFTDNLLIDGWRLPNPGPAFPDGDLTRTFRNLSLIHI